MTFTEATVEGAQRNRIDDAFKRSVRKFRDGIALTFSDRGWTFRELDVAVGRVARCLIDLGLRKGERVAAFGRNSDAYLILWLACCRTGLVHVPINYALTIGELRY